MSPRTAWTVNGAPERNLEDSIVRLLADLPSVERIDRQRTFGRFRMDLLVFMRDGRLWVIEVKAFRVQRAHVDQIDGYMEIARAKWPERRVRGALVGRLLGVGLPERPDLIYRAIPWGWR